MKPRIWGTGIYDFLQSLKIGFRHIYWHVYEVFNACQKIIENGPPATYTLLNDDICYTFCSDVSWLVRIKHTGTQ